MIIRRDVAMKLLSAISPSFAKMRTYKAWDCRPLAKRLKATIADMHVDPEALKHIEDPLMADLIEDITLAMIAGDSVEITEDGLPIVPSRGVGATIIQLLATATPEAPMTVDKLITELYRLFPDRPAQTTRAIVYDNVPLRLRRRGLDICSDGVGYWLSPGWKTGVFRGGKPWSKTNQ